MSEYATAAGYAGIGFVAACVVFAGSTRVGLAQGAPAGADAEPPRCGQRVTEAEHARADALFQRGTEALADGLLEAAAELYEQALAHRDHPFIRYNLALALLELNRPVGAYHHLVAATTCKADGLDTDRYELAMSYLELVEKQLARLEVACTEPGAEILLDGAHWLDCPDRDSRVVVAGAHQLVADKPGFTATVEKIALAPGVSRATHLDLDPTPPPPPPGPARRPWAAWKPWAVVASGAVVVAVGGVLHKAAADDFAVFEDELGDLACAGRPTTESFTPGCRPGSPGIDADLAARHETATDERRLAIATYVVGGAALLTGLALVYWNQPRVPRAPENGPPRAARVAPIVSTHTVGVTARLEF